MLNFKTIAITSVICVIIGASAAAYVQELRLYAKLSTQKSEFDQHLKDISDSAAADLSAQIAKTNAAQAALAALDAQRLKERNDAQATNDQLRADVAAGKRRLRIAIAENTASSHQQSGATTTPGLGNGATIEISEAAGRNILDIRAGIIDDQAKLVTLQDYVRKVCRPESK